jgi:chorismate-pyruvate lyase
MWSLHSCHEGLARGKQHYVLFVAPAATASEISNLRRTFLESAQTVTHLLETLTGEALLAQVVRQYPVIAEAGNVVGVPVGQVLTQRDAVLRGRTTDAPYLYAESIYAPERLPESARVRLAQTDDPIGRVLARHAATLVRHALPRPERAGPPGGISIGASAADVVWARAYRLLMDGLPVFVIREWFFRSVVEALERRRPD